VRREDERRATRLVELAHEREDGAAGFGVEVRGGLVGQHQHRIAHERTRDRDALPLTARELVRALAHLLLQPHAVDELVHALGALRVRGPAAQQQRNSTFWRTSSTLTRLKD
jgi:hypothetical protein